MNSRNGQRFTGNCNYCLMKRDCRKLKNNKEARNTQTNDDSGVAFPACLVAIASFSTDDSAVTVPFTNSPDSMTEEPFCFSSYISAVRG